MKIKLILFVLIAAVLLIYYQSNEEVFAGNANSGMKGKEANLKLDSSPRNQGHVSYQLVRENHPDKNGLYPNKDELSAYKLITQVMDSAIHYYNTYTTASKKITVYYLTDPSVRADGNINGNIRFGPERKFMSVGIATHEVGHTIGVGTSGRWRSFMIPGVSTEPMTFSGKKTISMLRQITGDPKAQLFMDNQHFWPYGLNYATEYKSESDLINYCKILNAMLEDGLLN
ncbi:MAG TPA: hypothetical protein VGK10_11410 [Prolixibacteraceae bacterium]|jgi:hypothetical protein